jgi:hypothetical protein
MSNLVKQKLKKSTSPSRHGGRTRTCRKALCASRGVQAGNSYDAPDDHIHNVDKLGPPFHRVFTAEQAQSYRRRMQGFEYMFDQLDGNPEDVLHVSSSPRYDLMTAHDMGIRHKAFVKRGHEPGHAVLRLP